MVIHVFIQLHHIVPISKSACDRFNVGRATALRCVRRVVAALQRLAPKIIKWPTEEESMAISLKFREKKGFQGS